VPVTAPPGARRAIGAIKRPDVSVEWKLSGTSLGCSGPPRRSSFRTATPHVPFARLTARLPPHERPERRAQLGGPLVRASPDRAISSPANHRHCAGRRARRHAKVAVGTPFPEASIGPALIVGPEFPSPEVRRRAAAEVSARRVYPSPGIVARGVPSDRGPAAASVRHHRVGGPTPSRGRGTRLPVPPN
jgi:hypothetical protein